MKKACFGRPFSFEGTAATHFFLDLQRFSLRRAGDDGSNSALYSASRRKATNPLISEKNMGRRACIVTRIRQDEVKIYLADCQPLNPTAGVFFRQNLVNNLKMRLSEKSFMDIFSLTFC